MSAVNKIFIPGKFLDIYPYMDWLFLLCQDGDLLVARTENLVEQRDTHDIFLDKQT